MSIFTNQDLISAARDYITTQLGDMGVKNSEYIDTTIIMIAPYLYNYPKDILSKLSQLYDNNGTEYIFVCDKYMWPACGFNPFNQQPMLPWGKFRP